MVTHFKYWKNTFLLFFTCWLICTYCTRAVTHSYLTFMHFHYSLPFKVTLNIECLSVFIRSFVHIPAL